MFAKEKCVKRRNKNKEKKKKCLLERKKSAHVFDFITILECVICIGKIKNIDSNLVGFGRTLGSHNVNSFNHNSYILIENRDKHLINNNCIQI